MDGFVGYIISLVLGGGLLKGIESVYRAVTESKEKKILGESIGAKTPVEVESVAVATMKTALEASQNRIESMELERKQDRDYYLGQISDLKEQLKRVRDEMHSMEQKLTDLLADTDQNFKGGLDMTAIVAIPSEDEPVWKISSEKVPHMTILFLDDISNDPNVGRVWEYIAHAANSSLSRFYLDVTSRGSLGSDNADVLFFNPKYTKDLAAFRSQLLANPVIAKAYLSIDQYPQWTPHLTLGYPGTPAKEVLEPYDPRIYGVRFDKIALWTGDYSGPEFPLQAKEYDTEEAGLSMTDNVDNMLAHFGVKGMRWGRRKSEGTSAVEVSTIATPGKKVVAKGGQNQPAAPDAIRVAGLKQKAKASTTDALDTKELQDLVNRMNLEQQYDRLTKTPGFFEKIDNDKKKVDKLMGAGTTLNNVNTFLNTPIGGALRAAVNAKTGVKIPYIPTPKKEKK